MTKTTRSGFGTVGYCKLCSITDPDLQDKLDKRVGQMKDDKYVWAPKRLNEWMDQNELGSASRQVIYNHREHVKHPKDKMVTAVQKREIEHGVQPQQVNEDAFLDSLIAMGQRKIEADPDSVSIGDALKAVSIKKNSGKMGNAQNVLVQIMTGGPTEPTVVVEGEVTELP
jgi:hypothetical protein